MKPKRIITIVISVVILLIIYSKVDFQALLKVFRNSNPLWIIISLFMVVPITFFSSWRLQQLMPYGIKLGIGEANRLILAASTLNMILPSKMGDIAKAYFMSKRGHLSGSLFLALVVFEKTCDLLSLLLFCFFGLILYPYKPPFFLAITGGISLGLLLALLVLFSKTFANFFFNFFQNIVPNNIKEKIKTIQKAWENLHDYFRNNKKQLLKISLTSIFIWFLHLLQIWFFILALNAITPFLINLVISPLAILAGLLPLTFAGVGTRDAALILFYQPYFDTATGAALGMLCSSRYFLPAIVGLPIFGRYAEIINE
jgi:uncharacterized protein (TIRG00374 family)